MSHDSDHRSSIVYITHCVDTEGPLWESLPETFLRIKSIFDVDITPSRENLKKLQNNELDLGEVGEKIATVFGPNVLNYHGSWDAIDDMFDEIMSEEYRHQLPDSFGGGWIYNWACIDHVGFVENPRRRDLGYLNVFDHMENRISSDKNCQQDALHFHYHPVPFSRKAHHSATHYFNNGDTLFQVLARRIIERNWFPSVNRAGFHTTRPDSHWFMEQHIPFDISSQATEQDYSSNRDVAGGRFGDWRRAQCNWQPYHPSHDDYQVSGHCRRWIARCLTMGGRVRYITQEDVDQAFLEAREGKNVVLGITNHDYREMRPQIAHIKEQIRRASEKYPDVQFRYSEARDAMRQALDLPDKPPSKLGVTIQNGKLLVDSDSKLFGPQPFFAMKTKAGTYHHDNFDFQEPFKSWTYTFDENNFEIDALDKIGIGACDDVGNVTTVVIDVESGNIVVRNI